MESVLLRSYVHLSSVGHWPSCQSWQSLLAANLMLLQRVLNAHLAELEGADTDASTWET
jgi:hypothetical protein